MKKLSRLLLFFNTCILFSLSGTNENTWNKKNFDRLFSNKNPERLDIPGCNAVKIWMIIKRGNGAPTLKDIFLIARRLPRIRNLILKYNPTSSDVLYDYDLRAFRKWENRLTSYDYYKLIRDNEKDLMHVAERMQVRVPSLMTKVYSSKNYKFKYAEKKGPPYYFNMGLFDQTNSSLYWYENTSTVDPIIELEKLCKTWREDEIENMNAQPFQEQKNMEGIEMTKIVHEINARLKLPKNSISLDDIHLMHVCCLFETASNISTKSPWCSAFSIYHLKVLKYIEDLQYLSGHEHSRIMNQKEACVAFNDLLTFLESDNDTHKCTIYYTSTPSLLRVLLFFDKYGEDFTRKNLDITHVNPFETNLAFILYNCRGVFKVVTLHDEHVVKLPCCPHSIMCELSKIAKYHSDICNFDQLCDEEKTSNHRTRTGTLVNSSSIQIEYFAIMIVYLLLILFTLNNQ